MLPNPIITLTTDFGYKDPFVGIMKGVILGINPFAKIVDITHGISPQNILEAAITIEMSFKSFLGKTIHIVVVDPGVGSARRPILVTTSHYYFIGPDNGVFSQIYKLKDETITVIQLTSDHYFLPNRSTTFHGRDIFAPVAGWLSKGIDSSKFGEKISDYRTISIPAPVISDENVIEGEVIYTDCFGNVTTNIKAELVDEILRKKITGRHKVLFRGREAPFKSHYAEADDEGLYSLINSFGYLELFVKNGSASSKFDIIVGEKVKLILN